MNIKDLLYQNLDILLKKQSEQPTPLTMQKAIEIGAYVAAGVLRSRHKHKKSILAEEIDGVYKIVGSFYAESFPSFSKENFDMLKTTSLELLQKPTFDQDLEVFIQSILEAKDS